jgi:hypothetical protein
MVFKKIDTNGNGQLDLSEAMAGYKKIVDFVAKQKAEAPAE